MSEQNNQFPDFSVLPSQDVDEEMDFEEKYSNGRTKKDKANRKFYQKKRFIIPIVILLIIGILAGIFVILKNKGKDELTSAAQEVNLTVSDIDGYESQENTVIYNGVKYKYNENIATILCIGTDNVKTNEATPGKAGQADGLFVFAMDTKTGKTSILAIPRDSMTDISLYSNNGNYAGTERKQVCLAYAYGDGKEKSCENTVDAVSRLLYGIPINSYFEVNMQAVGVITDKLGGVKITPQEDIEGSLGIMYKKGQTYNILGNEALDFLRYRSKTNVGAAYNRMNNQLVAFLKAMANKLITKTKENILTPINCYNAIKGYTITDIDTSQITFLTSSFLSGSFNTGVEFKNLSGESKMGANNLVEFTPDKTAMLEAVLQMFYTKID
ncbi:MAG: LCP family protein [Clostridiales bacterium]|nr:LCP family protein [Candidatus Equinaster intestinalis]